MEINTIEKTPHDLCTGCFACMNTCPVDAIRAESDSQGFLCPVIDKSKCVSCGKCAKSCPILREKKETIYSEPKCYAAWSKDENIRFQSASGGIFTHLAQNVIEGGGAVVGARYGNDNLVEHALIYRAEDIKQFRQSKYVQSEIGNVFRKVKDELSNGKPLLFSGTPCQCAGLNSFLEKDYKNLILCDFICHGVNSPLVYIAYLRELENRFDSKIKQVIFRDKSMGWYKYAMRVLFENGKEYIAYHKTDPYMLGFLNRNLSMFMRESCYQCRFRSVSRPTDITLGDFWGIERCLPDVDNHNGVSAVMIHSEKGERLWNYCKNDVECIHVKPSDILLCNPCIIDNPTAGFDRKEFFQRLKLESLSQFVDRVLK